MTPTNGDSDSSHFGRYEVRGELGRGVSTVFDGWDPTLERRVAIKVVRLEDAAKTAVHNKLVRFRREAQVASGLVHPNIVGLYDYHEGRDTAYTVMELVDGQALNDLLRQRRRLPLAEAARIMHGLLSALEYVHARGIVHRDIKPANLILTRGGDVKLADFGIAHTESSQLTEEGLVIGTLAYMAPEQHAGREVDARSDIFAAGVLLQEMLTGRSPFEGAPAEAVRQPLDADELQLTRPVCERLDLVLGKAMAKRPQDRFADVAAFRDALTSSMSADQTQAFMPQPDPSPSRSRAVLIGVAALLVLAGMGYGTYRWLSVPAEDPRAPVRAAVATVPCSLVRVEGGTPGLPLTVAGLASTDAEMPLRRAVAKATSKPVAWRLSTFRGPYCDQLNLLRPLASQPGGMTRGLVVSLPDNRTAFEGGEKLVAAVTMPDFAAHLRLDYFSQDGSVLHMAPGDVFPDRALAPQSRQSVGEPTEAFGGWSFQEPFGRDMVIATASGTALEMPASPEAEDTATDYLSRLRVALGAAMARGDPVAATVLLVNTVARPAPAAQ